MKRNERYGLSLGLMSRFEAKRSLTLHKEHTTRRDILLDIADKQPVSSQSVGMKPEALCA